MIKAEVISHEGNPGPNWLDQCKAFITPWTVTVAILVAAALLVIAASNHHRDVGTANQLPAYSQSQQTAHLNPLTVATSSTNQGVAQATSSASVQASPDSSASQTPANTTANVLGAKATPSLNTARSSSNASQGQGNAANPDQLSAKQLSQGVQSTVNTGNGQVKKLVTSVTDSLGL